MPGIEDELRAMREGLLTKLEIFWRDRYEWFQRLGYTLRPRYAPDWVPSWKGTNKWYSQCEDGIVPLTTKVMDAVRDKDGEMVVIKHYSKSTHPYESDIALYLSSPPVTDDPRNHFCPILDVFDDPYDSDQRFIIMPLLRMYDEPKFATVGEAMEFFRQTFEGLQLMHDLRVAHRDISKLNIMMDPKPILPNMFHPQLPWRSRDNTKFVSPHTRTARPVKYYFTDYGLSRRYSPEDTNPLELPIMGGDRSVPEFKNDHRTPRNPFYTDVYYMGNLIRCDFLQTYNNFAFMEPLITRMVQDAPEKRPTMNEVVAEFRSIASKLSWWKLRERLVERRDSHFMNLLKGVHYVSSRAVPNFLTRRSPIPTPKP